MGRWRWFVVASAAVWIGALPASASAADQAVAERIDTGHTGFASGAGSAPRRCSSDGRSSSAQAWRTR
jgi:hypothetical protein